MHQKLLHKALDTVNDKINSMIQDKLNNEKEIGVHTLIELNGFLTSRFFELMWERGIE